MHYKRRHPHRRGERNKRTMGKGQPGLSELEPGARMLEKDNNAVIHGVMICERWVLIREWNGEGLVPWTVREVKWQKMMIRHARDGSSKNVRTGMLGRGWRKNQTADFRSKMMRSMSSLIFAGEQKVDKSDVTGFWSFNVHVYKVVVIDFHGHYTDACCFLFCVMPVRRSDTKPHQTK